jgi:hypothetical protein
LKEEKKLKNIYYVLITLKEIFVYQNNKRDTERERERERERENVYLCVINSLVN